MSSSSQDYFTPESHSASEGRSRSTTASYPLLTKSIRRPRLQEKMVKNLLARRYGSLHDFSKVIARWSDIAKATGVHPDTIRKAVLLYHARGNRFLKCCGANFALGRPKVIPPELERTLISKESLYEMRFLSLPRRVELIRRDHGVHMIPKTLAEMYKRNGIRFLQPKETKRTASAQEARRELERIAYANKLHTLEQQGQQLIYMDEATFVVSPRPAKTW